MSKRSVAPPVKENELEEAFHRCWHKITACIFFSSPRIAEASHKIHYAIINLRNWKFFAIAKCLWYSDTYYFDLSQEFLKGLRMKKRTIRFIFGLNEYDHVTPLYWGDSFTAKTAKLWNALPSDVRGSPLVSY